MNIGSDSTLTPPGATSLAATPARPRTPPPWRVVLTRQNLTDPLLTTAVLCGYALVGSVEPWRVVTLFVAAFALEGALWLMRGQRWWPWPQISRVELQAASACLLNLLAIVLAPQVGGLLMLLLFAPLCAGTLAPPRAAPASAWWMAVCLMAALAAVDFDVRLAAGTPAEKAMLALGVGAALWRFMAVQARARGLRSALYDRARELERQSSHLSHLARHDDLTGLPNRREAMRVLQIEADRADRCGTAMWIAMLDADHFKQVNDHHGHAIGDVVLKELSQLLHASLRSVDHVFRFGGEEFLLLLVDHADGDATRPLERLREAVQQHDWSRWAPGLEVTISIGMTERGQGEAPARVLRRADAALYQAKQGGRNRLRLI